MSEAEIIAEAIRDAGASITGALVAIWIALLAILVFVGRRKGRKD